MRFSIRTVAFSSALCVGLLSGASLLAQDATPGGSPEQSGSAMHRGPMSPDQELSHLTKALDLTSDQQTRIKPILQNRRDQLMQIRGNTSLSREDRMGKMKALDDESNSKLEAVLTEAQKPKYEQMVQHRKERMEQMRAHRGQGAPPSEEQPQ